MSYFGEGCEHLDLNGKEYIFRKSKCTHKNNKEKYQGNCRFENCPLNKSNVVQALKCDCDNIIYSRARHDMRSCSCKTCFIDGGQYDYFRYGGNGEIIVIKLDVSYRDMYIDWNTGIDKLGLIKGD